MKTHYSRYSKEELIDEIYTLCSNKNIKPLKDLETWDDEELIDYIKEINNKEKIL